MPGRISIMRALPVLIFATFCAVMAVQILRGGDKALPSALIGKPAPALDTVQFGQFAQPSPESLKEPGPKLVNYWASWCPPCRAEHPSLVSLAQAGIPIIGINHKDQEEHGLEFLAELGNPYDLIGADPDGRVAIEWGVYGLPETFVIDGSGRIRHREAGPVTLRVLNGTILPLLEQLQGE